MNYIAPDEPVDRATLGVPGRTSWHDCATIKRRVDPDNVFRSNLNIAPAD